MSTIDADKLLEWVEKNTTLGIMHKSELNQFILSQHQEQRIDVGGLATIFFDWMLKNVFGHPHRSVAYQNKYGLKDVPTTNDWYRVFTNETKISQSQAKPDIRWICNECNAENFTGSVSADEIKAGLHSCISCGGNEFHISQEQPEGEVTFDECKIKVAKKYGFGKLVMGHLVKYFDEAAELYAQQMVSRAVAERNIMINILKKEKTIYLEQRNKYYNKLDQLKSSQEQKGVAVMDILEDMDSMLMQFEDVLHGEEGKLATTLRHKIIEIKNELRQSHAVQKELVFTNIEVKKIFFDYSTYRNSEEMHSGKDPLEFEAWFDKFFKQTKE